jgi:hypothetical protein
MSAFINALREEGSKEDCLGQIARLLDEKHEMATEIDRFVEHSKAQAARIEELEKALEPIAAMQLILARPLVAGVTDIPDDAYVGGGITYGHLRTAARALRVTEAPGAGRQTPL